MSRVVAGLAAGLLTIGGSSLLRGDEPPPLTPPVLGSPIALEDPPLELPAPLEPGPPLESSEAPRENRPMLVIPGVNTPRPGQRYRGAAPSSPAARPNPPMVIAPRSSPTPSVPPSSSSLPEILESGDRPPSELVLEDMLPDRTRNAPPSIPPRSQAPEANRRPLGFLGRVFGQGRSARPLEPPIRVEPSTDQATDAAVKRRAERMIEETLGDKLRAFNVRVVGRDAVIRAESLRFWQRRALRARLKALPALAGYRTTVLLDE